MTESNLPCECQLPKNEVVVDADFVWLARKRKVLMGLQDGASGRSDMRLRVEIGRSSLKRIGQASRTGQGVTDREWKSMREAERRRGDESNAGASSDHSMRACIVGIM